MENFNTFSVIGSGGWGTAIACHIARIYHRVDLYSRSDETIQEINKYKTNFKYLGVVSLPSNILATGDMKQIVKAEAIFIAVPSSDFGSMLDQIKKCTLPPSAVVIIATKGILSEPIELLSERFRREFSNPFAFFYGPNFAIEVANQKFAVATIASEDINLAADLARRLGSHSFEFTLTDDIITVQVASLLKNIIAIKSGILEAQGAGENAKAALIVSGLREIAKISKAMGGREETLLEPAVVGDLVLTSYSLTSRNTRFGFELHKNNYSKEFISNYPFLIEGIKAAKLVQPLIAKYGISIKDLPLTGSVVEVLAAQ